MITIILALITTVLAEKAYVAKRELVWAFATTHKSLPPPKNANILGESHPLFKFYQEELKDYKQTIMAATLTRIEMELRDKKKLMCYPGSSEFSRRREFTYLTSQYIQPAPQLVVTKKIGQRLLKKYTGKVSLKEIMNDKSLKGSLAEGRSYGEEIDQLLKDNGQNIKRQVYNTFIQTVIPQIKISRIDYTLEYPFVVNSMEAEDKNKKIPLMTIPLSDVKEYVTQYIACTKSPEGLEVIKRLDRAIRENVSKEIFWKGVLRSVPEGEKKNFQRAIDSFITQRKTHASVIE